MKRVSREQLSSARCHVRDMIEIQERVQVQCAVTKVYEYMPENSCLSSSSASRGGGRDKTPKLAPRPVPGTPKRKPVGPRGSSQSSDAPEKRPASKSSGANSSQKDDQLRARMQKMTINGSRPREYY